jgi:DnaK suppressor protein
MIRSRLFPLIVFVLLVGIIRNTAASAFDQAGIVLSISERSRTLTAMIDRHLQEIAEALAGLDAGAYGIYARCGEPIPSRRLQALPAATLCVSCQNLLRRRKSQGR